jgi:two-component system, OmpR family, alkaline phosphatase synthesis response regulator PhoP
VTTILVVDDEQNLVRALRGYLEREGYTVLTAYDGPSGLDTVRTAQPDLIVLDVMLPGLDGVEVCRRLRQFSDAYVLMLTARAEEIDKVVGLSVGADDYLTKPFSPRELVARVKAMLRRPRMVGAATIEDVPEVRCFGDLVIDESRHEVTRGGEMVPLTALELRLLLALASYPGHVLTRLQLLERVWGDDVYDDHVIDVHIGNLRKKLEPDPTHPTYVRTVRGAGYCFDPGAS